jgi:hypothetical protein
MATFSCHFYLFVPQSTLLFVEKSLLYSRHGPRASLVYVYHGLCVYAARYYLKSYLYIYIYIYKHQGI